MLIDRAPGSAGLLITVDRSRCLRMRFNRNTCPVCTSNCPAAAIAIHDDIAIDAHKCTLCMVCVSECPADCFDISGVDFYGILARLRKIQASVPYPVLGCKTSSAADAHEKTVCLGALSEEHLIALNTFMDKPVHLNLTTCAHCGNSFIIDTLKERLAGIRDTIGIAVAEKTVLIENKADLRFVPVSCDRRGFFSTIRNMTVHGAAGFFEDSEGEGRQAYSEKRLPLKRTLLNRTIRAGADRAVAAALLREYAYTIAADDSCDKCCSCIGLCPTGALKRGRHNSETDLLFNPSLCIGCGLCRDFCPTNSLSLRQGYTGEKYFGHEPCAPTSHRAVSAGDAGCKDVPAAVCYDGK